MSTTSSSNDSAASPTKDTPTKLPATIQSPRSGTTPAVPISSLLSSDTTEEQQNVVPSPLGSKMADGKNEARALRVLEIMNDFRTLQTHTTSLVTRSDASPPNQDSYYLDGYVVLRQCNAEAQAILATHYNPGNLGLESGSVPDTEVQKATLQRIILDASTRRFQAHKIYLRAAAGMRWVQLRAQVARTGRPAAQLNEAYRAIDLRLREELSEITDEKVVSDLRGADRRKGYWITEDPSLDRMLAWIRRQR